MTSAEPPTAVKLYLDTSAQHLRNYLAQLGTAEALGDRDRLTADPAAADYHQTIGPILSRSYPAPFVDALSAHLAAVRYGRHGNTICCRDLASFVPVRLGRN